MSLKVPPVFVFIASLAMIFGCYYLLPNFSYDFPLRKTFSRCFIATGAMAGLLGIWAFRSQKTTIDPMNLQKVTKLVTGGVYQYTRNPMYLGMALILVGGMVRIANPFGVLSVCFFVGFITHFQIKPEEKVLRKLFGKEYLAYCDKVRRWV